MTIDTPPRQVPPNAVEENLLNEMHQASDARFHRQQANEFIDPEEHILEKHVNRNPFLTEAPVCYTDGSWSGSLVDGRAPMGVPYDWVPDHDPDGEDA